jgi:hypothetical protein
MEFPSLSFPCSTGIDLTGAVCRNKLAPPNYSVKYKLLTRIVKLPCASKAKYPGVAKAA